MANQPIPAQHPDLEPEAPAAPIKRSPLFGIARTRILSLDKAVQKTLQSTLDRWNKNRIEFIGSLPEETRRELLEAGELQLPKLTMPSLPQERAPQQAAAARRPEPVTGFAGSRVNGVAGYRAQ